jgi:parallel beta-helix repeat protein
MERAMEIKNRTTVIVLAILIGSALTAGYFASTNTQPEETVVYPRLPHLPISIGDASDFTPANSSIGCACVLAGSGSSTDPYIIAGWSIDATETDGISVRSVDKYFIVTQVTISGAAKRTAAIRLDRVASGKVSNSTIDGTFVGLSVLNSKKITVVNNIISKSEYGIWLEASNSNTISDNNLSNIAQVAIFVRGSDNLIERNSIEGGFGGINIDGTPGPADRNTARNNQIRHTAAYGIGLWRAHNNSIVGNVVADGMSGGILITEGSGDNTIKSNEVRRNGGDGIVIAEQSSGNVVQGNVVKGNGDGVQSFDLHSLAPDNTWTSNDSETKEPDSLQ